MFPNSNMNITNPLNKELNITMKVHSFTSL
jgi:hypothetical protein